MNFILELVEERVRPHQVTALHLIAALMLVGAGALSFLIRTYAPVLPLSDTMVLVAGSACLLAGMILLVMIVFRNRWLLHPQINQIFRIAELIILCGTAAFFTMFQWWIPAAMSGIVSLTLVFSLFWEKGKNRVQRVAIDKTGVHLPAASRRRQLNWSEVDRVMLRFGVLTIDCHDNRLMQWNVKQTAFESDDFEQWCLQQIEIGKEKRVKSNW